MLADLEHRRRAWRLTIAAITVGGLIVRALYCDHSPTPRLVGDPRFYHDTARALADGLGYVGTQSLGLTGPTAEHPPLYSLLVAGIDLLGGTGEATQRLVASLTVGAFFIPVVGYLGRRVGGQRVGVIAAVLAAVWPTLVVAQSSGESEALFGVLVALMLLAAYRFVERPGIGEGALLGLWIGLATLTRSDAILFLAVVVIAFLRSGRPWRSAGMALLVTALLLTPWVVRNWTVFGRPTLSTNFGALIGTTNCRTAYYGRHAGSFRLECLVGPKHGNELNRSNELMRRGTGYAGRHLSRLPYLFAVRFLEVWGLRDRRQFDIYSAEPRVQAIERDSYYPLLGLAVAGAILLRRRRRTLWPLLVPPVITSLIAIGSWGTARFRHPSEVAMVALAAVALGALADLVSNGRRKANGPAGAGPFVLTS